MQDAYYAGFDPVVSASFATFGWGWHMETGIHALRMILGGVFDRYPSLQLILGHWGEMIPFYLARVNEALSPAAKHLQRPVADYFLEQVYVTPSGMFTLPPFLLTLQIMGQIASCTRLIIPLLRGIKRERFLSRPRSVLPTKRKLRMATLKRLKTTYLPLLSLSG